MAREGGDTALTAAVLNDLGNFLATRRKAPEAVAVYRESAALAERTGDISQRTRARVNLARALREAGDARAAREALDDALASAEQSSPSREASFLLVSIGVGYRELRAKQVGNVRELLELDLKEVSLVTLPANDAARVQTVKSIKGARDLEEILRSGGMSNNQAKKWAGCAWRGREADDDDAARAVLTGAIERLTKL